MIDARDMPRYYIQRVVRGKGKDTATGNARQKPKSKGRKIKKEKQMMRPSLQCAVPAGISSLYFFYPDLETMVSTSF